MSIQSVNLYYRDGRSDKVYQAQIEEKGQGYIVNFQYGRRGSTLTTGSKTSSPVPLSSAKTIYDKLIAEKKAKGYTEDTSGSVYTGNERVGLFSGLVPQLLNPIDEGLAQKLISDNAWIMQEKMDGHHQMVRIAEDVTVSNRKGLVVPGSSKIITALRPLIGKPVILDGETIGDVFHAFDILELEGKSLRDEPALNRHYLLIGLLKIVNSPFLRTVRCGITTRTKGELYEAIKAEHGEGVVFKQVAAKYVPGRPASGGNMLKWKFNASATCTVLDHTEGKRSVLLGMLDSLGGRVPVGCVTIPPNYPMPDEETCVEVEYLYAYPQGSLYQPVYKGPREDKDHSDDYSTLKFKQGTEEDDA